MKSSDNEKWVYSRCRTVFDGGVTQSFGNDFARNVVIFGIDSSSSCHTDNYKNNFLILREGPTCGSYGGFGSLEKWFSISFSKARTKFCLGFHYNGDSSYLFVNGQESFEFEANKKNVNFSTQFCLRSISDEFHATKSREVSLGGNVYNISVDCNAIDKSDILNIHQYLMVKDNIKYCWDL